MKNYDVIVVGGGPAGLSASIYLQDRGLDVALLESNSEPQNNPGEILHPGIKSLLEQLGVLEQFLNSNFLQHDGINIKWDTNEHFQPYSKQENWQGFQILRKKFDGILFEKAQQSGVNIVKPYFAKYPIIKNNQIIGVHTDDFDLESSMLIDATGRLNWLGIFFNLPFDYYSQKIIVRFGYVKGTNSKYENPSLIANPNGWTWIAKISNNLYQWIKLNFDNKYDDSLPSGLAHMSVIDSPRSADVTWRIATKLADKGYFLIGDAAFVLDPASSHGVLKSIMSGMMAAHMILKTHKDSSLEFNAIIEYSNWMKEWFHYDMSRLKELYQKHPNSSKWKL